MRLNAGDPAGGAIMLSDGSDMATGKKAPQAIANAIAAHQAQKVVDLYFRVDRDINKLMQSAKRKGAKVTRGLANQPYGMREFTMRDPDGYLVTVGQELARPRGPAAASPAAAPGGVRTGQRPANVL